MTNRTPEIPFEARAYQDFVRGLRGVWRTEAYARTVDDARPLAAGTVHALEHAMRDSTPYQLYGWLERLSQQFKYLGRWGMVTWLETQRDMLSKVLADAMAVEPQRLHLDPGFVVPDYVRNADTHQHPGATWSNDIGAFVYEWGTDGVSFSQGDSERPAVWFAELATRRFAPNSILDVGCSVGKLSRALKRAAPQARVDACDVAAPMLKLAHLRSVEAGLEIGYWQRSAEQLGFADAAFDLVTSFWLFHEMPPPAIRRALREMRRVLRPGGGLALYDMYLVPGGLIGEWLHNGYAARNNEPFAAAFARMDLQAELRAAGFADVEIGITDLQRAEADVPGGLPPARTHFNSLAICRAV